MLDADITDMQYIVRACTIWRELAEEDREIPTHSMHLPLHEDIQVVIILLLSVIL
jgi:hypothetical protein